MPVQVFRCPAHGEFDINIPFSQDIPPTVRCKQTVPCCDGDKGCHRAYCSIVSPHVIKAPAGIVVQGGTGAGRGHSQARKDSAWDTKVNEQQHDPYTQAKYQLDHVYNEQRDMGHDVPKVTEASIQETAKQIAVGKRKR